MKRMTCFVTLIFSVVLFSTALADTITVRADNWCPYNCIPGAKDPGYMIEIATLIFSKAGHTVDYQIKPWSRALDETRKGRVLKNCTWPFHRQIQNQKSTPVCLARG